MGTSPAKLVPSAHAKGTGMTVDIVVGAGRNRPAVGVIPAGHGVDVAVCRSGLVDYCAFGGGRLVAQNATWPQIVGRSPASIFTTEVST